MNFQLEIPTKYAYLYLVFMNSNYHPSTRSPLHICIFLITHKRYLLNFSPETSLRCINFNLHIYEDSYRSSYAVKLKLFPKYDCDYKIFMKLFPVPFFVSLHL